MTVHRQSLSPTFVIHQILFILRSFIPESRQTQNLSVCFTDSDSWDTSHGDAFADFPTSDRHRFSSRRCRDISESANKHRLSFPSPITIDCLIERGLTSAPTQYRLYGRRTDAYHETAN